MEKRILVQSLNGEGPVKEGDHSYFRIDFHMVNLEDDEAHLFYLPSLFKLARPISLVSLDNFVYTFGCISDSVQASDDFKRIQSQSTVSHHKFFLGGSCLNLNSDQFAWISAPISLLNPYLPRCTSLFGKIYNFGSTYIEPEVLDPSVGVWKPLPPPPQEAVGRHVSNFAVPDPSNRRILVHLIGNQFSPPSLYAFTPADDCSSSGSWELLSADFNIWSHVAVVVDDVIYFQSYDFTSVIRAYDLVNRTFLKVHWSSNFKNNIDMNNARIEFDALFHLGDGIFCLTMWSPIHGSGDDPYINTQLLIPKFRAKRHGEVIKLVPISVHTYVLPDTSEVHNFLLL